MNYIFGYAYKILCFEYICLYSKNSIINTNKILLISIYKNVSVYSKCLITILQK